MNDLKKKWFWMMDYCKTKQIPSAQSWAWDEAEKQYNKLPCEHEKTKGHDGLCYCGKCGEPM
ncbi:MAG: hypothetical protein V3W20_02880 [Candidatus Neomarinimicrobiota bacterium]